MDESFGDGRDRVCRGGDLGGPMGTGSASGSGRGVFDHGGAGEGGVGTPARWRAPGELWTIRNTLRLFSVLIDPIRAPCSL